jgi:hypothetical protein
VNGLRYGCNEEERNSKSGKEGDDRCAVETLIRAGGVPHRDRHRFGVIVLPTERFSGYSQGFDNLVAHDPGA